MYRNIFTKICTAGVASAILLSGLGAVHAEQVQVRYQAYELASRVGVETVSKRIDRKVARACYRGHAPSLIRAARECRADLTQQVVSRIDHPVLTAIYAPQQPGRLALNATNDGK